MNVARQYNFKLLLLGADLVAFLGALLAAAWVRYDLNPGWFKAGVAPWPELLQVLPYVLVVWALCARFSGLYRLGLSQVDEMIRLVRAVGLAFLIIVAATFFYRDFSYSRAMVLIMVPFVLGGTLLMRTALRFLWHQVLQLEPVQGGALVVGTTPIAGHLVRAMRGARADYQVRGVVATDPTDEGRFEGAPVVGDLGDLDRLLHTRRYQAVLVADGKLSHDAQLHIAEHCLRWGARYQVVPDIFELMLDRVQIDVAGGLPLLALRQSNLQGVNFLIKRMFDVVGSAALLLLASPVMLATALGIKLASRGPVFFSQERVGLHGRTFRFLKFRSMHVDNDDSVHREYVRKWIEEQAASEAKGEDKTFKITRDPRVFRFGAFIRKYSIDELPQLINVLKGEMSLIGPRPPIPYEVESYREWHRRRFDALPGITGLWQVSGRNRLSFDEMVQLDIEYIDNWSVELDLRIALKTVGVVLSGGAY